MAEWRTLTRNNGSSSQSFQVIGYPFAFLRGLSGEGEAEVLRCFPQLSDHAQDVLRYELFLFEGKGCPPCYDLIRKTVDEDEEIFEEGWYLSGIGHHLEWCDVNLESAVDVAQELIAWDGQDPTAPGLPAIVKDEEGFLSHKLPYSDFDIGEDDPMTELYGKRRFPYAKKPPSP